MSEKECEFKIKMDDFNNNEPYCGMFDKNCDDLSHICDTNCTVFEMTKKLQAKEARIKELEEALNGIKSVASGKDVTMVAAEWLIKKIEQALEAKE